jgi:hypothetical protein
MVVSYEEAREIVRAEVEPGWTVGTFCLDDRKIAESPEYYVFEVGAREYLVDGDDNMAVPGGVPVVYKADGRFAWLSSVVVAYDDTVESRPNPSPTLQV